MRNIAVVWTLFAAFCIAGCDSEDLLEPQPPVDLVNVKNDGSYSKEAFRDVLVDDKKVGSLRLSFNKDTLEVSFYPEPGLYVRFLRYHIATSLNGIPQINGKPDVENFAFTENTRRILLSTLTGTQGFRGRLYIAAYAHLAVGEPAPTIAAIEASFRRTHSLGDPSYFMTTVSVSDEFTGEFEGFCLQGDQKMDTAALHTVKVLLSISGDTTMLESVVDNYKNLDLVNWVLNQKRSSWMRADNRPATGADIQMVIWRLIERTGQPTGRHIQGLFDANVVNKIVQDALLKGEAFRPVCGQKLLTILHKGPVGAINERGNYNTGAYANPDYQVSGAVVTINCSDDERYGWAQGRSFPNNNGTYFGFEIR